MAIMVVGSGGYIGGRLCGYLERLGVAIAPLSSAIPGGIDRTTGLLPDGFAVPRGTSAVIFLAQSPWSARGSERAEHVLRVNCVSAVAMAMAAIAAGVPRFVYASTGNVYRPSFAPLAESSTLATTDWYALSKVHAEQSLALFSGAINVHCLRLFGVYGPGQIDRLVPRLVDRVRRGAPITLAPPVNDGTLHGLRLSLTYIDDVCSLFARVAHEGGPPALNVAGDEVLSVRDIAEAAGARLGVEPVFEAISEPRAGDLIADNRLMHAALRPRLTSFERGLAALMDGFAPA